MVIWITGLPGAGKTTIAQLVFEYIKNQTLQTVLLDGDSLRAALKNEQYDASSRQALAMTYSRLAKMFSEQGQVAICATVSMFDAVREWNRANIDNYFEIYVKVSAETLAKRNQKSLYSNAQNGEQKHVHGFDLAVEEPKNPDLIIENDGIMTLEQIKTLLKEELAPWLKN
ncbi:adenylyl-sulfate kinase [Thalassotalea ganghwensis]